MDGQVGPHNMNHLDIGHQYPRGTLEDGPLAWWVVEGLRNYVLRRTSVNAIRRETLRRCCFVGDETTSQCKTCCNEALVQQCMSAGITFKYSIDYLAQTDDSLPIDTAALILKCPVLPSTIIIGNSSPTNRKWKTCAIGCLSKMTYLIGYMNGLMGFCKNRSLCVRRLFLASVILTAFLIAFEIASIKVTGFRGKLQETGPYRVVVSHRTTIDYTALDTGQHENDLNMHRPFVSRYIKPIINTSNHVESTYCGVTYSKEMDLLSQEPVKGLPQFKNPCWYEDNIFRCFPYFFFVKASKTGTSDLYNRLLQHPHYVKSKEKEPNWFSQRLFSEKMTLTQYLTTFYNSAAQRILQDYTHMKARNASYNYSFLITGDSSTTYHYYHDFWPIMPGNYNKTEPVFTNADYINHFNPRAKIIYSVRNPIDRLWSCFLYSTRGDKSADTFHKVVVEGTRVYRDCFKNRTIRSCVYDKKVFLRSTFEKVQASPSWKCPLSSMNFKTTINLRIGLYSVLIKDFLQVFPRDQIFIQRLEDRSEDMEKSMREIFKFLEMDQLSSTKMREIVSLSKANVNAKGHSRYGNMKNETRRILYEFYKPFNKELAALFGEEKLNYGMQG